MLVSQMNLSAFFRYNKLFIITLFNGTLIVIKVTLLLISIRKFSLNIIKVLLMQLRKLLF